MSDLLPLARAINIMSSEIICHDITESRVKIAQPHEQSDHHSLSYQTDRPCVSVWPHSLTDPSPSHRLPVSSATRAPRLLRPSSPQSAGAMAMAAIASPSSRTLIPPRHHGAAPSPSTSGDSSLRLLRAHPRHGRRGRAVSVSTPAARSRPFVFSPRAVSDSKSSQTCLDPDASTVCPAAHLTARERGGFSWRAWTSLACGLPLIRRVAPSRRICRS